MESYYLMSYRIYVGDDEEVLGIYDGDDYMTV